IELPEPVLAVVGGHHERLDGGGYPFGITAEELTAYPRIAAVADMYDAMITDRPYRAGMPGQEILALLRPEAMEGLIGPDVVATMARIARQWEERRRTDPLLQGLFALPAGASAAPPRGETAAPSAQPIAIDRAQPVVLRRELVGGDL